jgi:segregation and condensation protein B
MNPLDLKNLIEATLLAAQRPVTETQFLELFDDRDRPTVEQLQEALTMLAADYEPRGIELIHVASGWRIQIRAKCMDVVSRLWQERPSRYSRALLETLALIAYRQPITRSEIEDIRGVAVSSTIMRTLQERNWIRVVGHREVPGRPEVLGTTKDFLDYFGLQSLDQLPTLAELSDIDNVGVQLELPGGDLVTAANEPTSESTDDESATGELSDATIAAGIAIVDSSVEMNAADSDLDAQADDDDGNDADGSESPDATTLVADTDQPSSPLLAPASE